MSALSIVDPPAYEQVIPPIDINQVMEVTSRTWTRAANYSNRNDTNPLPMSMLAERADDLFAFSRAALPAAFLSPITEDVAVNFLPTSSRSNHRLAAGVEIVSTQEPPDATIRLPINSPLTNTDFGTEPVLWGQGLGTPIMLFDPSPANSQPTSNGAPSQSGNPEPLGSLAGLGANEWQALGTPDLKSIGWTAENDLVSFDTVQGLPPTSPNESIAGGTTAGRSHQDPAFGGTLPIQLDHLGGLFAPTATKSSSESAESAAADGSAPQSLENLFSDHSWSLQPVGELTPGEDDLKMLAEESSGDLVSPSLAHDSPQSDASAYDSEPFVEPELSSADAADSIDAAIIYDAELADRDPGQEVGEQYDDFDPRIQNELAFWAADDSLGGQIDIASAHESETLNSRFEHLVRSARDAVSEFLPPTPPARAAMLRVEDFQSLELRSDDGPLEITDTTVYPKAAGGLGWLWWLLTFRKPQRSKDKPRHRETQLRFGAKPFDLPDSEPV